MDHQGAGRRSAADTRRQPPWPSLEDPDGSPGPTSRGTEVTGPQRLMGPGSGAQPVLSPGSGAQPVLSPGTGAQPALSRGSGAQPALSPGTGAQPALSRGTGPQPALGAPGSRSGSGPAGSFGRTPVRGFPPGREPVDPFPGGPAADTYADTAADTYSDDDTFLMVRLAPADTAGQDAPPGRRRGGRTKRRFRSRSWLAAAVVVVLAAAGFASYRFLYEPRVNAPVPPTLRLPTDAPGSSGFDKALGPWQHIGTRAEDPEPLTIAGLYPPQFVLNGVSYIRTAASVTKTCSLAVYGADLQTALQSGHCTQVLRASYISGDGKMMGTVGVVNLINSSAAQKAGHVSGPQEIIAPLSGKKGATKKLGTGTGVVQAVQKGHYLILMWAQFTNLKSPSDAAQRQALEQFAANLVTGSANINLSTRMLTGKG